MATQLIAPTTLSSESADFEVTDPISVVINSVAPLEGAVLIQFKTTDGYITIGELSDSARGKVITGPGTYRVIKNKSSLSYGVDRS